MPRPPPRAQARRLGAGGKRETRAFAEPEPGSGPTRNRGGWSATTRRLYASAIFEFKTPGSDAGGSPRYSNGLTPVPAREKGGHGIGAIVRHDGQTMDQSRRPVRERAKRWGRRPSQACRRPRAQGRTGALASAFGGSAPKFAVANREARHCAPGQCSAQGVTAHGGSRTRRPGRAGRNHGRSEHQQGQRDALRGVKSTHHGLHGQPAHGNEVHATPGLRGARHQPKMGVLAADSAPANRAGCAVKGE